MRHVPLASTVRRFSTPANPTGRPFPPLDTYPARHIGPNPEEAKQMLAVLGYDSMEAFVKDTVPDSIRIDAKAVSEHSIPAFSESEMLRYAEKVGRANEEKRSFIGMGYWNAVVPQVILRNVSRHCHFRSSSSDFVLTYFTILGHRKPVMVYSLYALPA
jgi:glycine dehydrogenase